MKIRFLLLLLSGFWFIGRFPLHGQTVAGKLPKFAPLPKLIPYRDGNLWGYADSTGTLKIKPKYKKAEPFVKGFAKVEGPEGWGLLDEAGKELIALKFEYIELFDHESATVYHKSRPYEDRYSEPSLYNFREKKFKPHPKYTTVPKITHPDLKAPLIRTTGSERITGWCGQGTTIYLYGLKTEDGKQILPPVYHELTYLGEGLFRACGKEGCLVINEDGKEILPKGQDMSLALREGLLVKCVGNKCGFIDKTGKEIIPLQFEKAQAFSDGLAAVQKKGKWGYIDKKGRFVIKPAYTEAEGFRSDYGFALVKKGKYWGVINKDGKPLTDFSYTSINYKYQEKFFDFASEKTYYSAFFDPQTRTFTKLEYRPDGNYREGLIKSKKDYHHIGFLNENGQVIIPAEYQEVRDFNLGRAAVKKDGLWGVVDKNNRVVLPCIFPYLTVLPDTNLFVVAVQSFKEGPWYYGLVNDQGKEILPAVYFPMEPYANGFIAASKNGTTSIINLQEPIKIPPVVLPKNYSLTYFDSWKTGIVKISSGYTIDYIDRYGRFYFNNPKKKPVLKPIKVPFQQEEVYVYADQAPEFPGGEPALKAYFTSRIPPQKKYINSSLAFSLVIDKTGKPKSIENTPGIDPELNTIILEAIRNMPRWKPAIKNHEPVNFRVVLTSYITYIEQPDAYSGEN